MKISEQDLRRRYESMVDEQLLTLRHQGTLTETAKRVLDEELSRRQIPPEVDQQVIAQLKQQHERSELLPHYGARYLGRLIDNLVFLGIGLITGLVTLAFAVALHSNELRKLAVEFTITLALGYWLFCDAMPDGQSVGKRVMGTAVVDASTLKPCRFGQSFLRNVFRLVLGPFDWITLANSKRQRVGDLVANTMVINISAPVTVHDSTD